MPELTSYHNSGTFTTTGLADIEKLPTSPGRNWREGWDSVSNYSRRVGESWGGTSSLTVKGQRPGLMTGANATEVSSSDSDSGINAAISPIDPTGTSRIVGLRKWAGQIHSVENGLFTVELLPLDHDGPELFADFELELLAPDERSAKPGAIVYLTTRMIQVDSGRVEAVTNVRLRQARRWSKTELDEVNRRGRDRARSFAKYARGRTGG